MNQIPLAGSNLSVSELCLGTGSFGTHIREEAADRLLGAFLDAGGNFVDTAHCYAFWEPNGEGASERELGASLRRLGGTERAVIATKGGHPDAGSRYSRPDAYLSAQVLRSDIDDSLMRLAVDRIDLYYLHRDDPRMDVEEILGTLNAEIALGRLRALGASNWSVERLQAANEAAARNGWHGFVISQIAGSLADPNWTVGPDPTMRYLAAAERSWHTASQLPISAYSATANGYFAHPERRSGAYDSPANSGRRDRATQLAAELNASPTQIALAWLRAQPFPVIPLFSTSRPAHLQEAIGSTAVTLTAKQVSWLGSGAP